VALVGCTVIVTGAASGMGQATALLAAREGAAVVCLDVVDPGATTGAIADAGGDATAVTGDIRDAAVWEDAVALARREHGRVDVLANVAGVVPTTGRDTVVEQSEDEWHRIIDINVKGTWLGMRAVLPQMIEQGAGRIVNFASIAAIRGLPKLAAYSASKAAIAALTRQAAVEYGGAGVRVNAIAPGDIDTPMSQDNPPKVKAALRRKTPAGRQGKADELAAAVVFLAGPGADFINGELLVVDGGWSARA
jgi:NAD(P)-dependent dehydrogenase (short-subunit alcohol dehydrogenase family)